MFVHTLLGERPPARSDGAPWTEAQIESALEEAGPWSEEGLLPLSPLDSDPSAPISRDFSFDSATSEGFFRLTFLDADGNSSGPTEAVFDDGSGIDWKPTVADVALLLRARTYSKGKVDPDNPLASMAGGSLVEEFTADTRPTGEQVKRFIAAAATEVRARIGQEIDDGALRGFAKNVTALRAAMSVEVSYQPEQANGKQSSYAELKELYEEGIAALMQALPDSSSERKGFYSLRVRSDVAGVFPTSELLP